MDNCIEALKERGLLDDVTSPDLLKHVETPTVVYAGFDPTFNSLQLGNFVTIMGLSHFQRCGHKVIALVGGATGLIGDPSGKSSERPLLSADDVAENAEGIRENLSRFLDLDHPTAPAMVVNNGDWFRDFTFVEFLRDVGKHFRMGTMLGKESVRSRLQSESGMSFTEFSYQLLQAYDFLRLFDAHGCRVQIGGSDQWGNITAGIDLVRKLRSDEVFGATLPLVCDSAGQKFGKSAGNALFLDAERTSYYDLYQFFIRTADEDVVRYLKIFTFMPMAEIRVLAEQVEQQPEAREAQALLAEDVVRRIHGEAGLRVAKQASAVMFGASMEGLRADDLLAVLSNVPSAALSRDAVAAQPVVDVAAAAGLCKSKGEARRLVQSGGLYVNNVRVADVAATVAETDIIDGRLLVLRSGKKRFLLIKI